jgi:hypothetical protein
LNHLAKKIRILAKRQRDVVGDVGDHPDRRTRSGAVLVHALERHRRHRRRLRGTDDGDARSNVGLPVEPRDCGVKRVGHPIGPERLEIHQRAKERRVRIGGAAVVLPSRLDDTVVRMRRAGERQDMASR